MVVLPKLAFNVDLLNLTVNKIIVLVALSMFTIIINDDEEHNV